MIAPPIRPTSAVPWHIGLTGLLGLALGCVLAIPLQQSPEATVILLIVCTGLPMWMLELKRYRGHATSNPSAMLPKGYHRSCRARGIALAAPVWIIAIGLNTIPAMGNGLAGFWQLLAITWPILLIALVWFVSSAGTREPHGVELMGRWLLHRTHKLESSARPIEERFPWTVLRDQLVKAFFLPLMLSFMHDWVLRSSSQPISELVATSGWFLSTMMLLYLVDTTFAAVGYLSISRHLNSEIRSSNPYLLGWIVALICYPPFFNWLKDSGVNYQDTYQWNNWLSRDSIGYYVWAGIILVLTSIYALSSVVFGIRFSNLTNRGIITHGPYRWTKHPAYISKNISWWMISIPFIPHAGYAGALLQCAALLTINYIYFSRARTEERHLLQDPTYQAYAAWINKHGLIAILRIFVRRFIP